MNVVSTKNKKSGWEGQSIEFVTAICFEVAKKDSDLYGYSKVKSSIYSYKTLKESYGLLLYSLLKAYDKNIASIDYFK